MWYENLRNSQKVLFKELPYNWWLHAVIDYIQTTNTNQMNNIP